MTQIDPIIAQFKGMSPREKLIQLGASILLRRKELTLLEALADEVVAELKSRPKPLARLEDLERTVASPAATPKKTLRRSTKAKLKAVMAKRSKVAVDQAVINIKGFLEKHKEPAMLSEIVEGVPHAHEVTKKALKVLTRKREVVAMSALDSRHRSTTTWQIAA